MKWRVFCILCLVSVLKIIQQCAADPNSSAENGKADNTTNTGQANTTANEEGDLIYVTDEKKLLVFLVNKTELDKHWTRVNPPKAKACPLIESTEDEEVPLREPIANMPTPLNEGNDNNTRTEVTDNDKASADQNEVTMMSESDAVLLLVAQRGSIRIVDSILPMNSTIIMKITERSVYSVDYHYRRGLIFYASNNSIFRAKLVAGGMARDSKVVIHSGVDGAVSLAVDWIRDRLYWMADNHKVVESANLDGTDRTLLTNNVKAFTYPNNIAVDPYKRLLFFVSDYAIFKYHIDKKLFRTVTIEGIEQGKEDRGVRTFALDRVNHWLYVTGKTYKAHDTGNVTTAFFTRTDYRGNSEGKLFSTDKLTDWSDILSISVFRDSLYFAHHTDNNATLNITIYKTSLLEFRPERIFTAKGKRKRIRSIKILHPCVQKRLQDVRCDNYL